MVMNMWYVYPDCLWDSKTELILLQWFKNRPLGVGMEVEDRLLHSFWAIAFLVCIFKSKIGIGKL